jgi:hypothetical protein
MKKKIKSHAKTHLPEFMVLIKQISHTHTHTQINTPCGAFDTLQIQTILPGRVSFLSRGLAPTRVNACMIGNELSSSCC